jgi:U1 small nuclear ribonucleoprotein
VAALFAPRPPLPFKPPVRQAHHGPLEGLASYVGEFEDPQTVDYSGLSHPEQIKERRERKGREKLEKRQIEMKKEMETWDPHTQVGGLYYLVLYY